MAKADNPVQLIAEKRSLGAEFKGKYALVSDVERIVKDLQFFYIIATAVSTTTDFGALEVGDIIVTLDEAAGTPAATTGAYYLTCAAAGTLPAAAVVGNLYIVLRPNS